MEVKSTLCARTLYYIGRRASRSQSYLDANVDSSPSMASLLQLPTGQDGQRMAGQLLVPILTPPWTFASHAPAACNNAPNLYNIPRIKSLLPVKLIRIHRYRRGRRIGGSNLEHGFLLVIGGNRNRRLVCKQGMCNCIVFIQP